MSNARKARSGDPRKQSTTTKEHNVHQTMSDIANDDTVVIETPAEPTWWDHVKGFFTPAPPKTTEEIREEMAERLAMLDAKIAHEEYVAIARDAVKGGRLEVRQSRREVNKARRQLDQARRRRLRFEIASIFRRSTNRLNTEETMARRDMLTAVVKRAQDHLTNAQALHETNKRNLSSAKVDYRVAKKGTPAWLAKHSAEDLAAYRDRIESRVYTAMKFRTNVRKAIAAGAAVLNTVIATLGWVVVGVITVALALVVTLVIALKLLVTAVVVAFFSMVSMMAGTFRSVVLA